MTINKFQGKTEEEAIEKAKAEFGDDAVVMNVKEIRPKGFFSFLKSSVFEVTAAVRTKDNDAQAPQPQAPQAPVHDTINLAADEEISIPVQTRKEDEFELAMKQIQAVRNAMPLQRKETERTVEQESRMESRIERLSDRLEESLSSPAVREEETKPPTSEELNLIRILYTTLIKNEVNEKYVNQILDEVEKFIRPGNSVDTILSNVYQKLILRFGQPKTIELGKNRPKVVFFIGPTGVGKTTTIAKIASRYKVEYNKHIAFITADTYRIAATEQLQVYANILEAPMAVVYSDSELNSKLETYEGYDIVFVDTAGFSHKNVSQREEMKRLLQGMDEKYSGEVYLVLSATTKYKDLLDIIDTYHEISDYKLIFTKLDETASYGNILNIKLYSQADLSYVTNGQNVPDDIEVFDTQKIVKQLLGGNA